MTNFPELAATGIGSVPFDDAPEAARIILQHLPEMPFWPQMVKRGFQEDMVSQGAGGFPMLRADAGKGAVVVDPQTEREAALTQFYEQALSGDLEPFGLSQEEASGFYALMEAVAAAGTAGPAWIKGQVVGPVTFAGMVKQPDDKALMYDPELTQAVVQGLARKAAWQAQKIREGGRQALIFLDEPYLTGFGSAFCPITREQVIGLMAETMEVAREYGEIHFGSHCCGNTDWSMLLETPIDVLSFDAYGFFDTLILYEKALKKFLARGGWLAWGLIPTGPDSPPVNVDELWKMFQIQVARMEGLGLARPEILSRVLFTPACGLGYMSLTQAKGVLAALGELSRRGREWLAAS